MFYKKNLCYKAGDFTKGTPHAQKKYVTDAARAFGKRLAAARIEKDGWLQEYVANQIGVRQESISAYETGNTMPNPENFAALCKLLQITPNELLGFSEVKSLRDPILEKMGKLAGSLSKIDRKRLNRDLQKFVDHPQQRLISEMCVHICSCLVTARSKASALECAERLILRSPIWPESTQRKAHSQ